MPFASIVVVVITVAIVAALIAWFFATRQHPEQTATHSDAPASTTSEEFYGKADRPAGPDVEPMDPELLGGDQRPPTSATPEADARD